MSLGTYLGNLWQQKNRTEDKQAKGKVKRRERERDQESDS